MHLNALNGEKNMPDLINLSNMESVPSTSEYGFMRLNRFWQEPDGEMWDGIWENTDKNEYWSEALEGNLLPEYKELFLKYFQPNQKILEAGCGVGQVVLAMRKHGFDCHGLDFAEAIIKILNKKFPDIPFDQGDIRELPYEDKSFDGYISLGVIEHFLSGQKLMLAEAARIIKPGGHIILSVPALNEFRKSKIKNNKYNVVPSKPFFESCISHEELKSLLLEVGFDPIDYKYLNPVMPFVQETQINKLYQYIEDTRYLRSIVDRVLNFILPTNHFGHMIMVVARRR
jgi:ubiquinone/menaquinone biosynthesis C-methylase UbiE